MSCRKCVFHTTIEKEISKTDWNNFTNTYTTFTIKTIREACGYNPGNPVEIPDNRISCNNIKLKDTI